MPELEIVHSLPEDVWRSFADDQGDGNIFHTPEMFNVHAHTARHQPDLWAAINSRQQPVALFIPVRITVTPRLPRYFTARDVIFGGLLSDSRQESQEGLAKLLRSYTHASGQFPLFAEIRNLTDQSRVQPLLNDYGFHFHEHLNYVVDLRQPTDALWKRMEGQARTKIRKAIKSGVALEEVSASEKLPMVYDLLEEVYKRIQVPLAPISFLSASFDYLHPKQMTKILLAKMDDVYVGASVNLLYKDIIFGWYVGVTREKASYGINELLNWHIIEWGSQNGFKYFDFGGAGDPNVEYGPRTFKSKFGGTLVNYGRNIFVQSPFRLKLSTLGYNIYRRIF